MGAFDKINLQLDVLIKSIEVEQQRRGNGGGSGSAGGLFSANGDTTEIEKKIKDFDFDGLPTSAALSNKLESLKSKLKNKRGKNKKLKKKNKKGIFDDLLKTTSKILEAGRTTQEVGSNQTNQRLRQHVLDSIEVTRNSARQILMDCVREVFFAGDGICGGNSKMSGANMDKVYIKPREIDFLNMFRVDPDSDYGKIMYEDKNLTNNKEKVNRGLYYSFTNDPSRGVPGNTLPYTYQYDTPSNKTLFVANWEEENQWFKITGLTQPNIVGQNPVYDTSVNVSDFFIDYYTNMEMPDLPTIIRNAMLLTLKVASIESDKNGLSIGSAASGMDSTLKFDLSLDNAINDLERMLNKIFSFCGNNGNPGLKAQNPTKLFNENEEDDEFYFDFDDVEGIDLEDEDARLRKVLRFKDCGNFEVPYNPSHIEDFIYLEKRLSTRDWIDNTLSKAAADAYEQSNFSIDLPSFKFSLDLSFLINLPKALVMSIISPKMFLPIVTIYKLFVATVNNGITEINEQTAPLMEMDSKVLMRKLKKLFLCIIDRLFWKFLREFWKRVKVDLKNFLERIIRKILKEKFRRYYILISALIAILKKLIEDGIDNCQDLLEAIGMAINAALNASAELGIPQPLLLLVGLLPGFSSVKTFIDTAEEMSKNGIPTGDVNGEPNYLMLSVASQINSFAKNLSVAPFVGVPVAPGVPSYSIMKPG
jgi:hypothetical protein